MNQKCKVCGEPAAGFHFGAFTCEGCKSFFGRSYNNINSITDCKNNGECVINKKNRTACKACRLRKCFTVGMSKSGSRYGRRSNWFKIHCLLQEQQACRSPPRHPPPNHPLASSVPFPPHLFPALARPRSKEGMALIMDDYKPTCASSPESHRSGSPKLEEKRFRREPSPPREPYLPLHLPGLGAMPHFPHSPFLTPPSFSPFAPSHALLFPPGFHPALYHRSMLEQAAFRENNNDVRIDDHNNSKRFYLDEILKSQQAQQREEAERELAASPERASSPVQENPMDLSVRSDGCSPARRRSGDSDGAPPDDESGSLLLSPSEDEEPDYPQIKRIKLHPLDLTTKV